MEQPANKKIIIIGIISAVIIAAFLFISFNNDFLGLSEKSVKQEQELIESNNVSGNSVAETPRANDTDKVYEKFVPDQSEVDKYGGWENMTYRDSNGEYGPQMYSTGNYNPNPNPDGTWPEWRFTLSDDTGGILYCGSTLQAQNKEMDHIAAKSNCIILAIIKQNDESLCDRMYKSYAAICHSYFQNNTVKKPVPFPVPYGVDIDTLRE